MVGQVRIGAAARVAAALVALALSGAARVVALHAPAERHRCTCRSGVGTHHECTCLLCRRQLLLAAADDEGLPEADRLAARAQLQADDRGAPGAPCVDGACGDPSRSRTNGAGVEPFHLPGPPFLAVAPTEEPRPCGADPVVERTLEPELPPPRGA